MYKKFFNKNLYKLLSLLLLAVVVYFIAIFSEKYFEKKINPYIPEFEKQLHKLEIETEKSLNFINDKLKQFPQENPFSNNNLSEILSKKGIFLFVYFNDTIKYWTSNYVPSPYLYPDIEKNISVVNLKNGYYEVRCLKNYPWKIIGYILIKNNYNYQNDYLSNTFNKFFKISDKIQLNFNADENKIKTKEGSYIFSLQLPSHLTIEDNQALLILFLYVIVFILLLTCAYIVLNIFLPQLFKLYFLLYSLIAIVLTEVIKYILPTNVKNALIFSPQLFATTLLPSLGYVFINVFLLVSIIIVFYKKIFFSSKSYFFYNYFIIIISFLSFIVLFNFYTLFIKNLIIDSKISLNFNDILSFDIYSIISYFVVVLIIFSLFIIGLKISQLINEFLYHNKKHLWVIICFFTLCLALNRIVYFNYLIISCLAIICFSIILICNILKNKSIVSTAFIIIALLVAYTTIIININLQIKEKDERKLLAINLLKEQDPVAEYLFQQLQIKLLNDKEILDLISVYPANEDIAREKILKKYFYNYWNKYNVQLTLCSNVDKLTLKPDSVSVNCDYFFNSLIKNAIAPTLSDKLFFIPYNDEDKGYLGIITLPSDKTNYNKINLYIEFIPKFILKGIGLPELLIDKKTNSNKQISYYSYARYKNNKLIESYGKYIYPSDCCNIRSNHNFLFFNNNGYNHLLYEENPNKKIIISKKNDDIFGVIAPFHYLFVFSTLIIIPLVLIFISSYKTIIKINLQSKLQIYMLVIIIVSFFVIGTSSLIYIIRLNNIKNNYILDEKAHSVLVELQNKFSDKNQLSQVKDDINLYFKSLNNVFFTDINLFDLNGELFATSRPEIYDEGLIAPRLDFKILQKLKNNMGRLIIKEAIGKMEYLSIYIPFVNNKNQIIAYLNLPYFARQNELEREIIVFINTFINIFVFITAIAVIIVLIISKYVTMPLQLIRNKISTLKLGHKNEKIQWNKNDEIGYLIVEYNKLIDELEKSALLLAKSERESAWKEMAKQVAHEIKNPLTPMKLNVQYLQKVWNENIADKEKLINNFIKNLIEQIDTLSEIASEFSDFAKMPDPHIENVNLVKIIDSAIDLYKNIENIKIKFDYNPHDNFEIYADKKQMLRVFNNLLNNSVQAIPKYKNGEINISIYKEDAYIIVIVKDNGQGIPEEQKNKIFIPNFSTKTGGMGLGLVIVKNIIEIVSGEINFYSQQGEGTTFIIKLPANKIKS